MHKGEFVSDINYFYQLPSYLSNSLLSQFFWFEKAEAVNIFFSPSINFWFSLTRRLRKRGREVGGRWGWNVGWRWSCDGWIYSGLAKQAQHLKPKPLGFRFGGCPIFTSSTGLTVTFLSSIKPSWGAFWLL